YNVKKYVEAFGEYVQVIGFADDLGTEEGPRYQFKHLEMYISIDMKRYSVTLRDIQKCMYSCIVMGRYSHL
ncbi:MAG: hypothetical protein QXG46_06400, partial [Ignisphaera sp.]